MTESARREAALYAIRQIATRRGPLVIREEDRGDEIAFVGTASDGRECVVGYVKDRPGKQCATT